MSGPTAGRGRRLSWIALGVWGLMAVAIGALLLQTHLGSLPPPDAAERLLIDAVRAFIHPAPNRVAALHVLYERCGCSLGVAEELARRGRRPEVREVVVVTGEGATAQPRSIAEQLRHAGFDVRYLPLALLAQRLPVSAAPTLLVVGEDGGLRYAGGYTARRGAPIEEARILRETMRGRRPESLPVFGCAVSALMRKRADPLGFKY
jgi:hypothetical protein